MLFRSGYGVRLSTYSFTADELHGALERLLGDVDLNARMQANAREIQARDGLAVAAKVIVDVARAHAGARGGHNARHHDGGDVHHRPRNRDQYPTWRSS